MCSQQQKYVLYVRIEPISWAAIHTIRLQAMNDNSEGADPLHRTVRLRHGLGQRLRERRLAQGIALSDAASAIGASISALEAIESGLRAINPQELCLLCQLLQVDISWPFDEPSKALSGAEVQEPPAGRAAVTMLPMTSVTKRRKDLSEA